MTSSCTSVAVWIISITAAMRVRPGLAGPGAFVDKVPHNFPHSKTRMGRSRFPPPDCRYWPM
jgi:hypothetical protein